METGANSRKPFDMGSLMVNLPHNRRGLSRYYSGKARSFACISDARCIEDLKKQDDPYAKKRKKSAETLAQEVQVPTYPCRRVASSSHCSTPSINII